MRILHTVSVSVDKSIRGKLMSMGRAAQTGFQTFEVWEDDPEWKRWEVAIADWDAGDIVSTRFSAAELAEAAWLEVVPVWHHGYPMPDDDLGYLRLTYSPDLGCAECGVGRVQTGPFRLKGEPRWGRRSILQLNWVFDEYFVRPALYASVFQPKGVECRQVLAMDSEDPLEDVVQLAIPDLARLDGTSLEGRIECPACGQEKFAPVERGYSAAVAAFPPGVHLMRSHTWFGDGSRAFRAVLASQEMRVALLDARATGVGFRACAGLR